METNPFSIENILKKDTNTSLVTSASTTESQDDTDEEPSKATAALSLAAKLAGTRIDGV